tara:strand:+ start:1547 stop:2182 length:636 start_codon:yes stop_codon:yes gene_type:complete
MEISQSKYSNSDKNSIKTLINKCSTKHCNKIYDMLILENIKMTKNNNGYFLNLSNVTDETIDKIKEMLNQIDNNNLVISNNIESDYEKYNIDEINKKDNIIDIKKDKDLTIELDDEIEDASDINSVIDNDNDNELDQSYYFDNDENDDDISNKFYQKKQELSPYLSKLIKKCKDIQKNNEMDNIDNIDDFDDCEYIFDANQELSLDLTYSI